MMNNRQQAEQFLKRFWLVKESDIVELTAIIDVAEERGEMRTGWIMDEPTREYDFTEEKTL